MYALFDDSVIENKPTGFGWFHAILKYSNEINKPTISCSMCIMPFHFGLKMNKFDRRCLNYRFQIKTFRLLFET